MKQLQDYIEQFREFVEKNYSYFGEPVDLFTGEITEDFFVANGNAYKKIQGPLRAFYSKRETIKVKRDEIYMDFTISEDTKLCMKKNFEGYESYFLEKRIDLDEDYIREKNLKGKVLWDGTDFSIGDDESIHYLRMKGIPYSPLEAIFDFDHARVMIRKDLSENSNLKKELETFDVKAFEDYLSKRFYNNEDLED